MSIPDLGDLISLLGPFSCSLVTFIIPPLLEMVSRWSARGPDYSWVLWFVKDLAIIAMGLVGVVSGMYATLVNIVRNF